MKKASISICLVLVLGMLCATTRAQDSLSVKKAPFSFNTDVVTSYIWRGLQLSRMPNLQPYFSFTHGGFQCGSWGSVSAIGDFSEIDLFASYSLGNFSLLATDYYILSDYPDENYFNYANKSTKHTIEASLTYQGTEKFPLTIMASTFVYGDDKDSLDENDYSTYIEAAYSFSDFDILLGFTPWEGYYGDGAGVVNAGIKLNKEIRINDHFSVPAFISLTANPRDERIFLTAGITF